MGQMWSRDREQTTRPIWQRWRGPAYSHISENVRDISPGNSRSSTSKCNSSSCWSWLLPTMHRVCEQDDNSGYVHNKDSRCWWRAVNSKDSFIRHDRERPDLIVGPHWSAKSVGHELSTTNTRLFSVHQTLKQTAPSTPVSESGSSLVAALSSCVQRDLDNHPLPLPLESGISVLIARTNGDVRWVVSVWRNVFTAPKWSELGNYSMTCLHGCYFSASTKPSAGWQVCLLWWRTTDSPSSSCLVTRKEKQRGSCIGSDFVKYLIDTNTLPTRLGALWEIKSRGWQVDAVAQHEFEVLHSGVAHLGCHIHYMHESSSSCISITLGLKYASCFPLFFILVLMWNCFKLKWETRVWYRYLFISKHRFYPRNQEQAQWLIVYTMTPFQLPSVSFSTVFKCCIILKDVDLHRKYEPIYPEFSGAGRAL